MSTVLKLLTICGLALLASCGGNSQKSAGGKTILDGYLVSWGVATGLKMKSQHSPVLFTFTHANRTGTSNIPESVWQARAKKEGWGSVNDLKTYMGKDAYLTAQGQIAICTYFAMKKGLCGKPLGLSVNARAKLAERVMAGSSDCNWIGFDKAFNQAMSYKTGGGDNLLWVMADCK